MSHGSQAVDDIDWYDVMSKGLLLTLSASWILIIQRLSFSKIIYLLLTFGFFLFFIGIYTDFWEEFKELTNIFGQVDNVSAMIGMGVASVGLYLWVNERIKTENQLRESKNILEEEIFKRQKKDILLKEVYHRVKNNFSVVSSLINLQSNYIKDKQAQQTIKETYFRIQSMAIIHQQLYESEDLENINFEKYINSLTCTIYKSYVSDPSAILLETDIRDVALEVDLAIPIGLIINELMTNSIKYAFPPSYKDKGKINISITNTNKNDIELKVQDNGVGLPADFSIDQTKSLGLILVKNLTKQINGRLSVKSEQGTLTSIRFKGKM